MHHFVWNIDPEIFRIGSFGPRYYGLCFAIGFLIGYHIMRWVFLREDKNEDDLSSLLFHIMVGTIVGARLGHCLFYEPNIYLRDPIKILYVWQGGLASHGGTIGVVLAVWLYTRKHVDQPFMWLADRLATPIALTAAFIRLGNFFNSEIIGKPSDLPWAIVFQRVDNIPRHPAMLYESLSYFVLFLVLLFLYKKKGKEVPRGQLIGLFFTWVFGFRFIIEFLKENQVPFESSMPLNMGQLLSIPFVILGIILMTGHYRKFLPQSAQGTLDVDHRTVKKKDSVSKGGTKAPKGADR